MQKRRETRADPRGENGANEQDNSRHVKISRDQTKQDATIKNRRCTYQCFRDNEYFSDLAVILHTISRVIVTLQ